MKISETGRPVGKGTNNRGFSLVEILVVLLVIALVGSLVALSVDSGSSTYEVNAANRMFRALATQARDEAELTGLDHGLTLEMVSDERGDKLLQYRWWRRTQEPLYEFFAEDSESGVTGPERNREAEPEWEVLDDVLYQTMTLPANLELKMSVADIPVDLARIKPRKGNKQIAPLMVFYASGEATPAVVEFLEKDTGDSLWRYQWDLLGELELEWRGEVTEDG